MSNRLRRIGELVVASLALALVAAPSAGAALPAGYSPTPVDNPATATTGDRFGEHIVNAGDVTGDGKDDLLVGVPKAPVSPGITGKVVFVDGGSGGIARTVTAPSPQVSHAGAATDFGAQVATFGDVNGDNVPEHLVSAPGTDINDTSVDMGVVYVLDGATFQIIKQIQLEVDDRPSSTPGFGKALSAAGGEPACGPGFGGTAACPDPASSLVARGDLDGGGEPDIVIGAPDYQENAVTDTNPDACVLPGPTCPGLGRVYVYSGESITGPAGTPLEAPTFTIKYFEAATAAQQPRLGAVVSPIGDVGSCNFNPPGPSNANCLTATAGYAPSNVPDGYPDYLVSAPGLTAGGVTKAGKAFVVDGQNGLLIAAVASPDPQQDSGFGAPAYPQAAGNLGGSALPDLYLSATGQNLAAVDQGRGYVLSGDPTAPGLLYRLDDLSASANSGFGVFAGLGDVAGDDLLNEFAIGRLAGGPVRIVSSCGPALVQTIADADPGNGFGAAIAPMGDINGDGYIDLAVGAPNRGGGIGRVYLMKSNGTPGPDPSCKPPVVDGGGAGGGGGSPGQGATPSTPKSGGKQVSSLAKRSLTLAPSRRKIKIGTVVKLAGRLRATTRKRSCQRKQKVAIFRHEANGGWLTIDVAVTKRNGGFVVSLRPAPAQTYTFRARVKANKRCGEAFSKRVRVEVAA